MTAHLHPSFVAGCFRCELSRDEAYVPPHQCDTGFQDRILCPEPCGLGHVFCTICGALQDKCVLDD